MDSVEKNKANILENGSEEIKKSSGFWRERIRTSEDVEAQRDWQSRGTPAERHFKKELDKMIFSSSESLKNGDAAYNQRDIGLSEYDGLVRELLAAAKDDNYSPSKVWEDVISELRGVETEEGRVNALQVLTSPNTQSSVRNDYFNKKIAGLLNYAYRSDLRKLRDEEKVEEESQEKKGNEEMPPDSRDDMDTSMDEMEKNEGEENKGYFSVHPFFGGYYRENVYNKHAGGSRWKTERGELTAGPEIELKEDSKKVFRGKVNGGRLADFPLPYGYRPDIRTVKASDELKFLIDGNGNWLIDSRGLEKFPISFTVMIGEAESSIAERRLEVNENDLAVESPYAGADAGKALAEIENETDNLVKARKLKRFVRNYLTYSNDSSFNKVYQNHPVGYFAGIEEHRQADCDVANAYYINLLSASGVKARLATGNYVKSKDSNGAASLNSGNRHAWTEVYNTEDKKWHRFDATPEGDPNADEEMPDELPEDEPGEGDFGEQEAPELTEEQLDDLKRKMQEAEKEAETREREKDWEAREWAKDAECSYEEALIVREKIRQARLKYANVLEKLRTQFQEIVETNLVPKATTKGPVKRSIGDEPDSWTMIGRDIRTGSNDPEGYAMEAKTNKMIQDYSGLDIHFVVDRSSSMNYIDESSGLPKKDEQQLACFILQDALYSFAEKTRIAQRAGKLISPLDVKSSLTAFQAGSAGVIKSSGSSWGPKEQYAVWKGLESNIGGGTPAHLGLVKVREVIEADLNDEVQAGKKKKSKPRVRAVMAFMDGEVDDLSAYIKEDNKLRDLGVMVSAWGMTKSGEAVKAYPGGHCVEKVADLPSHVSKEIIAEAKKLTAKKGKK